jgi:hypothetical protein
MINFSINYPLHFEIVNPSVHDTGQMAVSFKSGDYTFKAYTLRSGSDFNSVGADLGFLYRSNVPISGIVSSINSPSQYGLMPREMFKPFEYVYTYGTITLNTLSTDFVGRSEKDVRDYKRYAMAPGLSRPISPRMFSLNGNLLLVGQRDVFDNTSGLNKRIVGVYTRSAFTDYFSLSQSFEDVPASFSFDESYQDFDASPCHFSHNGQSFIVYMYKQDAYHYARLMKFDSSSNQWHEVSRISLGLKSNIAFDDIRIRAASDNTVILIVLMCSWTSDEDTGLKDGDIKVYVSYNSGVSFESNSQNLAGLRDANNQVSPLYEQNKSMLGLFCVSLNSQSYENVLPFSVRFDLYFDKNIGSFVILKAGTHDISSFPSVYELRNRSYLIGVRNIEGTYFTWEKILQLPLDYNISIPDYISHISPYDGLYEDTIEDKSVFYSWPYDSDDDYYPYSVRFAPHARSLVINDICVIPGDSINDIVLTVQNLRTFRAGLVDGEHPMITQFENVAVPEEATLGIVNELGSDVIVTEFAFLNDDVIRSGYYDNKIYAYGGKFHPNISFFCGPMSLELSSIVPKGFRTFGAYNPDPWSTPIGCRWNDSLVVSASYGFTAAHRFLAILGSVSNLGEKYGYQSQWFPYIHHMYYGWKSEGTVSYSLSNLATTLTSNSQDGMAGSSYLRMGNSVVDEFIDFTNIYPIDRFKTVVGKIGRYFKIKLRFSVDVDFHTSSNSNSITISAFKDWTGDLHAIYLCRRVSGETTTYKIVRKSVTSTGTYYNSIDVDSSSRFFFSSGPNNNDIELLYGLGIDETGEDRFFAWVRLIQSSTDLAIDSTYAVWNRLSDTSVVAGLPSSGFAVAENAYVGVMEKVSVAPSSTPTMYVKAISISSYGEGYRPAYSDSFYREDITPEGCSLYTLEPYGTFANFIKSYSRNIALRDGSSLILDQVSENENIFRNKYSNFTIETSRTKNSVKNILNGVSDSIYDFTEHTATFISGTTEIVFKNVNRLNVDCLSLINIVGIDSFTLRSGSYNEETNAWNSYDEEEYRIPYARHEVLESDGKTILVDSSYEYATDQVAGHTLFVANSSTGAASKARIITQNFENVLVLNSDLTVPANSFVKILKRSASFSISENIGQGNKTHFSIVFKSPSLTGLEVINPPMRAVGEVVFGRWCDLSDYHIEVERERQIVKNSISSPTGLLFSPRVDTSGNTVDKISVNFTYLREDYGDYNYCKNIFSSIYNAEKNFPIIFDVQEQQVTEYVSFDSEISIRPQDYGKSLSLSLSSQSQKIVPIRNRSTPQDS